MVLVWWHNFGLGGTISPCQGSDSSDEDSSEAPLAAQDVDEGSDSSSSCSGPAVREEEGKTEEDTDSEEDNGHQGPSHTDTEEEDERARVEEDGKGQGFTHNGEPEFKPKKVNFMVETFAHSSNHL